MTTSYRKPARAYSKKTPAQQLETAIEKCQKEQIAVAGSGTLTDGRRFWIVASQSVEGMSHIISQASAGLSCDCFAGQRGVVCVHRAAVYLHLKAAAATTTKSPTMHAVAAAAVQQAANAPEASPQPRQTASPVQMVKQPVKNAASALYDDSRQFAGSIYKPEGARARVIEEW